MMANKFPQEANMSALDFDISLAKAATNATSELKGKIVAAKNADKKSVNSAILSTFKGFNIFYDTCYKLISCFNTCPSDVRSYV